MYHAIDEGSSAVLILLDLNTALDPIDHSILLKRLQISFGITGSVLDWFHSFFLLGGVNSSALIVPGFPSLNAL